MSNYNDIADTAVRVLMEARRVERAIEQRLTCIDKVGVDVSTSGTVISFKKKFTSRGPAYTYAAVKRNDGFWSITSSKFHNSITWDELVLFMTSGTYPTTQYDIMVPFVELETAQGDAESPTAE